MAYNDFGWENAPDDWMPGDPAPAGSENAQQTAERMEEFGAHVHQRAVADAVVALVAHVDDATAAHAAAAIAYAGGAGISAVTVEGAIDELANEKQDAGARGQANGFASLGSDGKVPSSQLPAAASVTVESLAAALNPIFQVDGEWPDRPTLGGEEIPWPLTWISEPGNTDSPVAQMAAMDSYIPVPEA